MGYNARAMPFMSLTVMLWLFTKYIIHQDPGAPKENKIHAFKTELQLSSLPSVETSKGLATNTLQNGKASYIVFCQGQFDTKTNPTNPHLTIFQSGLKSIIARDFEVTVLCGTCI